MGLKKKLRNFVESWALTFRLVEKKRHRRSGGVNPVWNLRLPAMPLVARHYLSNRSNAMVISVVTNATIIGVTMLFIKKSITAACRCSL